MPVRRGKLLSNVQPPGARPLSDEQRVFIECVEDVLASTPGLRYAAVLDPEEIASRDPSAYALFLIRTNPAHDLAVAVELREKAFVIRVDGLSFARRRGLTTRIDWWIERRCRDLERLVNGDLRIVQQTLLNLPISSTLEAGLGRTWRKIASIENGWLAVFSFLVPYGFLMGTERKRVYDRWHAVDGDAASSP